MMSSAAASASDLLDGLPPGEAVTVEMLSRNAARRFSTMPGASRMKLVVRALDLYEERQRDRGLRDTPPREWSASDARTATEASQDAAAVRKDGRSGAVATATADRDGVMAGTIQIIPVPGRNNRVRLVLDQEVEAISAWRVVSTLCQVLTYQSTRCQVREDPGRGGGAE